MEWHHLAAGLAGGAIGGLVFWLAARLGLLVAARLPQALPFTGELLAGAGDRDRLRHGELGREIASLLAAVLVALIVAVAITLAGAKIVPAWPMPAWIAAGAAGFALVAFAIYQSIRLAGKRRRARFAWAARGAVGNVLERLNFSGNRVFHEVRVEGAVIDHVVVGRRGVFSINVVPRRLPNKAQRLPAELKNGKLRLAGQLEALPVGDAARNMTLLTGALSRIVGHRVPVRSVLAVPGWDSRPDGKGNHLVLNEKNLVMLTSWNTPDAYLMDEDCATIQAFLHEASRAPRL